MGCSPALPNVSIPERVWGGLERAKKYRCASLMRASFQSLRGFGVGWSAIVGSISQSVLCFNP